MLPKGDTKAAPAAWWDLCTSGAAAHGRRAATREGLEKIKLSMRRIRRGKFLYLALHYLTFKDPFGHAVGFSVVRVSPYHLRPGLEDTVGAIWSVELQ